MTSGSSSSLSKKSQLLVFEIVNQIHVFNTSSLQISGTFSQLNAEVTTKTGLQLDHLEEKQNSLQMHFNLIKGEESLHNHQHSPVPKYVWHGREQNQPFKICYEFIAEMDFMALLDRLFGYHIICEIVIKGEDAEHNKFALAWPCEGKIGLTTGRAVDACFEK